MCCWIVCQLFTNELMKANIIHWELAMYIPRVQFQAHIQRYLTKEASRSFFTQLSSAVTMKNIANSRQHTTVTYGRKITKQIKILNECVQADKFSLIQKSIRVCGCVMCVCLGTYVYLLIASLFSLGIVCALCRDVIRQAHLYSLHCALCERL